MSHFVYALFLAVLLMLPAQRYLHICQLEGYKPRAFGKWCLSHWISHSSQYYAFLLLFCIQVACNTWLLDVAGWVGTIANAAVMGFLYWRFRTTLQKKTLVYTARVWRLQAAQVVVHIGILMLCAWIEGFGYSRYLGLLQLVALPLLPAWTYLAATITIPMEKRVQQGFIEEARAKLQRMNIHKIGITGSYGKTSTKFILHTILSEAFTVLATPQSFNTTMGVVRTIRENLRGNEQVFIAEMGARQKGDIKELCDIVHPDYVLIVTVGKQHLETFGSLENVALGKYEIVEGLATGGAAFFSDTDNCRELHKKAIESGVDAYLYGFGDNPDLYVSAHDITVGAAGSSFRVIGRDGEAHCKTRLLGSHNIMNIMGGIAIARHMGVAWHAIERGVAAIEPVEHRLQLMPSDGITIIDDAFNANPAGVEAAMEVLRAFPGRKIVVTPGLVELGEEQDALNEQFGRSLAQTADIVLLIGVKQTRPIVLGMLKMDFPRAQMHILSSLQEATALLPTITQQGDVVLFENDLPDNYTE